MNILEEFWYGNRHGLAGEVDVRIVVIVRRAAVQHVVYVVDNSNDLLVSRFNIVIEYDDRVSNVLIRAARLSGRDTGDIALSASSLGIVNCGTEGTVYQACRLRQRISGYGRMPAVPKQLPSGWKNDAGSDEKCHRE